jgi:hypothetical protein
LGSNAERARLQLGIQFITIAATSSPGSLRAKQLDLTSMLTEDGPEHVRPAVGVGSAGDKITWKASVPLRNRSLPLSWKPDDTNAGEPIRWLPRSCCHTHPVVSADRCHLHHHAFPVTLTT